MCGLVVDAFWQRLFSVERRRADSEKGAVAGSLAFLLAGPHNPPNRTRLQAYRIRVIGQYYSPKIRMLSFGKIKLLSVLLARVVDRQRDVSINILRLVLQ